MHSQRVNCSVTGQRLRYCHNAKGLITCRLALKAVLLFAHGAELHRFYLCNMMYILKICPYGSLLLTRNFCEFVDCDIPSLHFAWWVMFPGEQSDNIAYMRTVFTHANEKKGDFVRDNVTITEPANFVYARNSPLKRIPLDPNQFLCIQHPPVCYTV